jgi:hypothetical protein
MAEIAEQTGGKLYRNGNDLVRSGEDAISDGDTYYAITYRPLSPETDKKFRSIEIKTKRHGVRLRCRRGYFPSPGHNLRPEQFKALKEVASEALLRPDVKFRAKATKASPYSAKIIVVMSPEALRLQPAAGDVARAFEISIAEHLDDRKLYISQPQKIDLRIAAQHYQDIARQGLPFIVNSALHAKSNWIRLIVRDLESDQYGTIDLPVVTQ